MKTKKPPTSKSWSELRYAHTQELAMRIVADVTMPDDVRRDAREELLQPRPLTAAEREADAASYTFAECLEITRLYEGLYAITAARDARRASRAIEPAIDDTQSS